MPEQDEGVPRRLPCVRELSEGSLTPTQADQADCSLRGGQWRVQLLCQLQQPTELWKSFRIRAPRVGGLRGLRQPRHTFSDLAR